MCAFKYVSLFFECLFSQHYFLFLMFLRSLGGFDFLFVEGNILYESLASKFEFTEIDPNNCFMN